MLEQAILDFIVSDLLLKAIPIIVLVVLVLEIVKTLAEKYDRMEKYCLQNEKKVISL